MKPRAQVWPVLNASAFTSFINEHCHAFFAHSKILRAHIKITGAKTIPAQRVLEFFDVFKVMSFKLMTQPEFVRLEERVLGEIDQSRRALASAIINLAPRSVSAMSTMAEGPKARDLDLVVKHLDKDVIESLKNRAAEQVIAQINNEIAKIQGIPPALENRVVAFKQLRDRDALFSIRQKKRCGSPQPIHSVNQNV